MRASLRTAIAAACAIALLGAAPPRIETVGNTRAAIVLPDNPPVGSVIVIPGGTTLQTIKDDGSSSVYGNFVMRIRGSFLRARFAIAYVEDPGDLAPIIARMRGIARPVFLLATSNGTGVAAHNAARLGANGPDGVVLTSTITGTGRRSQPVTNADVSRITVPVLFVHNHNDGCPESPIGAVAPLIAHFRAGADVTRIDVTSPVTGNDPCQPFSAHGYDGIETEVAGKILEWMHAHGAQVTE